MTTTTTTRTLQDDVRDLGAILGEVVREQGGDTAFDLVEGLRQTLVERRRTNEDTADVQQRLMALSSEQLETVVRAFGVYFNLINLAEEHERVRRRRQSPGGGKQSIDDALATWRHKHVLTVERIIGGKMGTGGTVGVKYLQSTVAKRAFPELWTLRTLL